MPTDHVRLHCAPPGDLRRRNGFGSQTRWFVVLWFLGVLAATAAAGVVKLLMWGAVVL